MNESAFRSASCAAPLVVALLVATPVQFAQAAEVRVSGNMTSDVLASGRLIGGGHGGERFTEHPGTTGWLPATPAGVEHGQTLGAHAAGASAALNLSGRARLGDLGISGSAVVSRSDPDGVVALASGGLHAEWFTGFEVFSSVLPHGSLVNLQFTWVVNGSGALLADAGNSNYLLAQLGFSGGFGGLTQGQGRHLCDDFEDACDHVQTFDLTARIGQNYGIRGQFDLGVLAATDSGPPPIFSNLASVMAGNSSHLYLDVLTPGVRYELDDSGLQFARAPVASVPEPGALGLWGLGLAGLALARRRESARCGVGVCSRRRIDSFAVTCFSFANKLTA